MGVTPIRDRSGLTVRAAVDRFLSSSRCTNPNTRRAYANVLDRLTEAVGPDRPLAELSGREVAAALERQWGNTKPATWNRNRAAVASWLAWCIRNSHTAPALPPSTERRAEPANATRALTRAEIERALTRRDLPLREKTLFRMLYETAARASEILALDVDDLDLPGRRAPVRSKGGDLEWVYWGSGTAHLLPRLIRGRASGPLFLSHRSPAPARRPRVKDLCPDTGRARLGYDRARILLNRHTGWDRTSFGIRPPPTSARPTSDCS